jgi:hypothetical protein
MDDNSMVMTVTWMEVAHIQERLAEARHNEKFGWGAVILSAVLVTLPPTLSIPSVHQGAQVLARVTASSDHGGVFVLSGLDLAAAIFVLSGVLVTLGVGVALYCRFLRSRLFDELRSHTEAIQMRGMEL